MLIYHQSPSLSIVFLEFLFKTGILSVLKTKYGQIIKTILVLRAFSLTIPPKVIICTKDFIRNSIFPSQYGFNKKSTDKAGAFFWWRRGVAYGFLDRASLIKNYFSLDYTSNTMFANCFPLFLRLLTREQCGQYAVQQMGLLQETLHKHST